MATGTPDRSTAGNALTPLPQIEDLPMRGEGYDPERVREAFEAYRRHTAQLQAQLRVLQAAGGAASIEPIGHAVRMDALHMIRAAAEFADKIERDAQGASASQLAKTEEEVRRRQRELQEREAEIERYRQESERQRAELLNAARTEARELEAKANRDSTQELQEAEARAARLVEQARHQATELTNAARAEVEQTLEWARAQGAAVIERAQQGAEQLLGSAGLGDKRVGEVAQAIVRAAEEATEAARGSTSTRRAEPSPATPTVVAEPASASTDEPADANAGQEPSKGRPKQDGDSK